MCCRDSRWARGTSYQQAQPLQHLINRQRAVLICLSHPNFKLRLYSLPHVAAQFLVGSFIMLIGNSAKIKNQHQVFCVLIYDTDDTSECIQRKVVANV